MSGSGGRGEVSSKGNDESGRAEGGRGGSRDGNDPGVEPGKTRIGWIGTGVMGSSMCGHLLEAGFTVTVHNRTREKAETLLERGAEWAGTPKAVAEASEVVFTMVGYPSDVQSVILGEDGVLAGCRGGNTRRRHDDEPAIAGHPDRRGGRRGRSDQHRRSRLRRRRRGPGGETVDHDRW